ncbi:ATP-binding protein [Streptomyces sp. NBC_00683]|uniref:ATP-binding protein n=1 Tax=Streptomyces sp. NBC_00683 TaxID=2903670 RepID=UPI002E31D1A7|nr:ATP-binding protein [Streptomyces sp. NBC_00683]
MVRRSTLADTEGAGARWPHVTEKRRYRTPRRAGRIRHPPQQLAAWGIAYGSGNAWTVALVTAELAANAITHGRLPDRDFRLALGLLPHAVRIEVTDTRPERLLSNLSPALPDATAGRGLLIVDAYAPLGLHGS